jgi:hypothetical protein
MSHRISVFASVVVIGAVFTAVAVASNSHTPRHAHQFHFLAVTASATPIDVDGDSKNSVGDELVILVKDYDRPGGTQIGTGTVTCIFVDATAGDYDCQGSDVLPGGEIREAGRLLGSDPTHLHWAIIGGIDKYRSASGQIDGTFVDAQHTQLDTTVTLVR